MIYVDIWYMIYDICRSFLPNMDHSNFVIFLTCCIYIFLFFKRLFKVKQKQFEFGAFDWCWKIKKKDRWLECESQFSKDLRHLLHHPLPPIPHPCVPLNEGPIFLFAYRPDRIRTVFPVKKDFCKLLVAVWPLPVVLKMAQLFEHISSLTSG